MGADLYYKKTIVKKTEGCSHKLMNIFKVRYEDELTSNGLVLTKKDVRWLEGIIDTLCIYGEEEYVEELQKLIEEIREFDSVELFISW